MKKNWNSRAPNAPPEIEEALKLPDSTQQESSNVDADSAEKICGIGSSYFDAVALDADLAAFQPAAAIPVVVPQALEAGQKSADARDPGIGNLVDSIPAPW